MEKLSGACSAPDGVAWLWGTGSFSPSCFVFLTLSLLEEDFFVIFFSVSTREYSRKRVINPIPGWNTRQHLLHSEKFTRYQPEKSTDKEKANKFSTTPVQIKLVNSLTNRWWPDSNMLLERWIARLVVVRVPNLYFGSRLGVQYPKNSKIFLWLLPQPSSGNALV